MNREQKDVENILIRFFKRAAKYFDPKGKCEMPPHEKGLKALYNLFHNGCSSVRDKIALIEAISSIVETSGHNKGLSSEKIKEIVAEHVREIDRVTPHITPLDPELRKEVLNNFKRILQDINDKKNNLSSISKERMMGVTLFNIRLISRDISDSYSRRTLTKLTRQITNSCFGRTSSVNAQDPNLMLYIAEMLQNFPVIWKNTFFRKVMVENEFLNQVYILIAHGKNANKAIKTVLRTIKFKHPSVYRYLRKLAREILSMESRCYAICDKRPDNLLQLFQMETIHRFLTNPESYLFIFDEPGTRKTATSGIAMVARMIKDGYKGGRIVVVCSPQIMDNWVSEIQNRLSPKVATVRIIYGFILEGKPVPPCPQDGRFHFDIIPNHVFSSKEKVNEISFDYDGIVVDEVHNFKKRDRTVESKRSNAIIQFVNASSIKYRLMITGTPLVNEVSEYANMVNLFSGKEYVNMKHLEAAGSQLDQACHVHFVTSNIVLRRCKEYIMSLPPIRVREIFVPLNEKQIKKIKSVGKSSNPYGVGGFINMARQECLYKVAAANKIIAKHNEKGLMFFNWISGIREMDKEEGEGIVQYYYDRCPPNRRKILITGEGIIDIDGKKMDYNTENAKIVRDQFANSIEPTVAYVSLRTCREGINEFKSGNFVIFPLLPYDSAQFDQATSRLHREGRDINKDCICYVLLTQYRDKSGKPIYYRNEAVKSFDERIWALINRKKEIQNVACDGVKKMINGIMEPWKDLTEREFGRMEDWARGNDKKFRFNRARYTSEAMIKIQSMNQDCPASIEGEITQVNDLLKNKDVESGDFFDEMENLKTAKDSKDLLLTMRDNLFYNTRIRAAHVGCGKADLGDGFGSLYKIDKFCQSDGIINRDRSEIADVVGKECLDFIAATDVMHWDTATPDKTANIDDTVFAFNESLKLGGYCLMTAPKEWQYPFAKQQKFLKNKGFKLIEEKVHKSIRYYLLQKVTKHQNSDLMSPKLLPKKSPLFLDK